MNKVIKLFTQEVTVVVLLGVISVITAWAGVQSSLLGGKANKALSFYMEGLSKSNNLFLTSELKYRTDLIVWADSVKTEIHVHGKPGFAHSKPRYDILRDIFHHSYLIYSIFLYFIFLTLFYYIFVK